MSFAELKAKSDGRAVVVESQFRGMIKAGKASMVETLIGSAAGAGNLHANWQRSSRAREAYRMLRSCIYEVTNCIARRAAGQHWMAGNYEQAPPQGREQRRYSKVLIHEGVRRMRKAYGVTDVEPDQEHEVLWLLDQPNKIQGRFELVYLTVMNLLLTGEWYWLGGVNGDKAEVWAIPSSWIVPDHSKGLFGGYKLQTGFGGDGIPIPKENIARGYFPDPSDLKACLSPLAACVSAAKIDEYILSSQEGMFARGINPNLVVTVGQNIGPDGKPVQGQRPVLTGAQMRQITRVIETRWNQTVNNGLPAILDGLVTDIHKLSNTPAEMDWQRSADQVKQRIYRTFGVNPYITGEITNGNRAQAVVAEQNFNTNVLNPILENISVAATNFFGQFYDDGETLAVWLEPGVAKDEDREDKLWAQARTVGDVTQDEVRSRMGLEPAKPEPKRSPLFNNPQTLLVVAQIAEKVSMGAMSRDNAIAQLVTMLQISEADADAMMPDDPPEPTPEEIAAQALAEQGRVGPPLPTQDPPAEEVEDDEDQKRLGREMFLKYDPNQPRNPDGTWGTGGSAPDRGDGSGAQGTSPSESPKLLGKWKNSNHKTAAEISGVTPPDSKVVTKTVYHITKRENAEKILKEGFKLEHVRPRWMNDYAVSLSVGQVRAERYFTATNQTFNEEKYAVLAVKIKGRYTNENLPLGSAYSPQDYTRQIVKQGWDGQDLNGVYYVHNPKSIVSIEHVKAKTAKGHASGTPPAQPAGPPAGLSGQGEEEPERATDEPAKSVKYDPTQPRNPDGTWGSGGSAGSLGESPVSDHAASILDRYTTPSTGSRTGEYEKARREGEAWVKGEVNQGWQDLYDETQDRLMAAGVSEIEAFRGIEVPQDHPLARAIADGKVDVGYEFEASGMVLASWSEDDKVATRFADSPLARAERRTGDRKTVGLVVRRISPAADVVTGARVHKGFLDGEKELVLRNTSKARVEVVGVYR